MKLFGQDLQSIFIPPTLRNGGSSTADFQTIATAAVNYYLVILTNLAAFVSFCYVLYSGYIMFTAFGDEAKYSQGKKTLTFAIIGLLIALLARFIIFVFVKLLGGSNSLLTQ